MQPLTCVPEADETKTMTVAWPHHACMPPSEQRQHRVQRARPARCGCIGCALLAPLRQHGVQVQEQLFRVLFTQVLIHLLQPIIRCVRAQSARDFVRDISGVVTPHRCGMAQS